MLQFTITAVKIICRVHSMHQQPAACTIFAKLVLAKNEMSKIIAFIFFQFELNIGLYIFI